VIVKSAEHLRPRFTVVNNEISVDNKPYMEEEEGSLSCGGQPHQLSPTHLAAFKNNTTMVLEPFVVRLKRYAISSLIAMFEMRNSVDIGLE